MKRPEAVWITGVGTISPVGQDFDSTCRNLLDGRSGIRALTDPAYAVNLCQVGGKIDPWPTPRFLDSGEYCQLDPVQQLLLCGAEQALHHAGLWDRRSDKPVGMVFGLGAEWSWGWQWDHLFAGGDRIFRPDAERDSLVTIVQRRLDMTGPTLTVGAACASGNHALAQARRWIELGWVDVCLAGACDVGTTPLVIAAFDNLRTLSRRNDSPTQASRPFDRNREGFVMSEACSMFVLESASHARRRSAEALAEIAGFGTSSDAFHMVIPSQEPAPAAAAMRDALADARIDPADLDYVNAHATATPVGDVAETRVLHLVLGEDVRRIPVSSTKSMTGHPLSGAAALETAACIAALERQAIPPTINLDDPDPECDLCHVAHQAQERKLDVVLSNSFGFGGSNTCLVLRRVA